MFEGCHDIQNNGSRQNDTRHSGQLLKCYGRPVSGPLHSILPNAVLISVILLNDTVLNVILLNNIVLNFFLQIAFCWVPFW